MERDKVIGHPSFETANDLMAFSAISLVRRYDDILSTARDYALEYIDAPLLKSIIFKNPAPNVYDLPGTPRMMIEDVKKNGPDAVSGILRASNPTVKHSFGQRAVDLLYADFVFYLQDEHGVTKNDLMERSGKFYANCAQYGSFMDVLVKETLPELSPTLCFGDVRVTIDGVENKKRMNHFWVELNNGIELDNSGIYEEVFDDHRKLLINENSSVGDPTWVMDDAATADGGWFNTFVEECWDANFADE